MSEKYTHGHHESVLRSHSWRTVDNSAAYIADRLTPGASVLDVGCGPGTITVDIAQRVAPGRVVGMDASSDVLDGARALAAEHGVGNVEFVAGDAYALDFADGSFDVVHAHQVLQHVADPVAVLREMRRVCAPGGVVAARDADYGGFMWAPRVPELDEWLELYHRVHSSNAGEPDAGRHLKGWAIAAGFDSATVTASMWSFATPEQTRWWGGSWADRIVDSAFAADALDKGFATRDDLQRIRDAWLAWSEHPDAWFGIPNVELRAVVGG